MVRSDGDETLQGSTRHLTFDEPRDEKTVTVEDSDCRRHLVGLVQCNFKVYRSLAELIKTGLKHTRMVGHLLWCAEPDITIFFDKDGL